MDVQCQHCLAVVGIGEMRLPDYRLGWMCKGCQARWGRQKLLKMLAGTADQCPAAEVA